MFKINHKKCIERENQLLERIGEEVEIQECKDKELLVRRMKQWQDELDALKRQLANSWTIDPECIFSVSKTGLIMLNGQQITTAELKNLKSEIRALKDFQIYKIFDSTVKQKAIEKAVLTSTDLYSIKGNEQVLAGKMMILNLDILKTIINNIDKAKLVAK